MRRKKVQLMLAVAATATTSVFLYAALLGVLPEFPTLVFDNSGNLTYVTGSKLLSIDASPIAIRFSASSPPRFVFPTGDPAVKVMKVRAVIVEPGVLIGGVTDEDLIIEGEVDVDGDGIVDYAGILLTGEVAEFGFLDSGGTTDSYDFRFTCTGGLLADDFFLNRDIGLVVSSEGSNFTGAFNVDIAGGAKGTLGAIGLRGDLDGCTPGYWKQTHHFDSWPAPFTPNTLFEDVFERDVLGAAQPLLVEALRLKRGGLNALMRHSVAALLNAAASGVNSSEEFDTPAEVIAAFQAAFDSGNFETTKNLLEDSNEEGCPLN